MFCPHCGKQSAEGQAFCAYCGGKLPTAEVISQAKLTLKKEPLPVTESTPRVAPETPQQGEPQQQTQLEPVRDVGFGEAIKSFYKNYVNFKDRSTRKEYWFAILFNSLISIGLMVIGAAAGDSAMPSLYSYLSNPYFLAYNTPAMSIGDTLNFLFSLATLIPSLANSCRRLHDTGKSGIYVLFILIPLVGPILLLVYLCTASGGDNEYGPRKTARNQNLG